MMSAYCTLLTVILWTVMTNGMEKTEMKLYRYIQAYRISKLSNLARKLHIFF